MKSFFSGLKLLIVSALVAVSGTAFAQGNSKHTEAQLTGQLADLGQIALKRGIDDELPAKLSGLLWPEGGNKQVKCPVKKLLLPAKKEGEGRVLFIRPDNHDIVLMKYAETVADNGESKKRQEFYYRTRSEGNLALVLVATLQFTKDLADNDILKDVRLHPYGTKEHPITPEITSTFEAEKKFWLQSEKKLKKSERH